MDLAAFRNPPAAYRPMPLWVWNGEMTEARITEMLEQFAEQGMGGVFVHPRPGLITEYLSERWFELWSFALSECKRLGLECNIYDENSYPAGFAGGHVSARLPHAASQFVEAVFHKEAPARFEGQLLKAYQIEGERLIELSPARLHEALASNPVLTLALRRASGSPWTAWFPMVDTTRPEVAREFIATTYEAYASRFRNDFEKAITSIFCDEPLVATSSAYSRSIGLPLSWPFLAKFRNEHGYDLLDKLADLFVDQENATATRFDYYKTLQRLWTHHFLKPLHEWCAQAGLRLSGHFMEQEWPYPYLSPSCMDAYRWMQMPGVDMLAPQIDFESAVASGHYVMSFRELNSAANQLGLTRRLCESHGVGGYEATFEEFKRASDWLMVHGVNFISQHLSYETISGARKYDHPQTFSDHSAWWKSYRLHADHVARLSFLLSQGAQRNRVLVLHSTTSGWIHANPARESSECKVSVPATVFSGDNKLEALRDSEAQLVQWLAGHQVDFDLGDELLMEDSGKANNGRLSIGNCSYSVLIIPNGMENWCDSTLNLVENYLTTGGILLLLREPPEFVNGIRDERARVLAGKFRDQWQCVASFEELQQKLDELVPPLITAHKGGHLPSTVGHHMRILDEDEVLHFVVNHSSSSVLFELSISGDDVYELETITGATLRPDFRRNGTEIVIPLKLPTAGHTVLLVSKTSYPAKKRAKLRGDRAIAISSFERIERTSPNVLGLDFCDLTLSDSMRRGLYVTHANRLCWQAHGFDRDIWDRAVQFRRNYFDFQFSANSGFRVDYHFEIAQLPVGGVELAIERPELYRVEVNGRLISFENAHRWFDETIRAVKIGEFLHAGRNTVSLTASPFHVLCEIDRIYLLGDFAIEPASPGFRITSPVPLKIGDWTKQGLAQYPGSILYTARITLDETTTQFAIETPEWAGSVIAVTLNEEPAGDIAFPPYRLQIEKELAAGTHELTLEVIGTPKNLLGPHFCKQPRGQRWTGPNAWETYPDAPADGADYEILPYGLLAPAKFTY